MNMRSLKALVIIVSALVAGVIVLNIADDTGTGQNRQALLPELDKHLNDIGQLVARYPEQTATIVRDGETWLVREKDDFPADTGTLRQVLLALRDAAILEKKTANPALHGKLGLSAPGNGDSIGFEIHGEGVDSALVLGNEAQQKYRYVRFADQDQTWLIDQNPKVPDDAAGWLAGDIVNIPSSSVRSVSIAHADGETIRFSKSAADDGSYRVDDLPEGRELSYPGVVNGIAGALNNLRLDDVRKRPDSLPAPATTTTFTTDDGLQLVLRRFLIDEASWFALQAAAVDAGSGEPSPDGNTADADAETGGGDTPSQRAAAINQDVGRWLYRLPDARAALLQRRWDALLKAPAENARE